MFHRHQRNDQAEFQRWRNPNVFRFVKGAGDTSMIGTLTAIAMLTLAQDRTTGQPKWYDDLLCGMQVNDREIYDPSTGYMLVGSVGCGGTSYEEVLTRDRYEIARRGFQVPEFHPLYGAENGRSEMTEAEKPLALKTGHGVRIGDSPSAVVKRLGKPTRIKTTGTRKQFRVFVYYDHTSWWEDGGLGPRVRNGHYDEADYTFKKGKLIEISFSGSDDITG